MNSYIRTRHVASTVMSLVAGLLYVGCAQSSLTSTNPSPVKCQVTVAGPLPTMTARGGSTMITVSAQPECAWNAVADASWIAELKPNAGQGDGQVEVVILPNATPNRRQGSLTINGSVVPIAQDGAPCQFVVTAPNAPVAAGGGTATIGVSTTGACSWTASSPVTWITLSPAEGSGSGSVTFVVAASSAAPRTATLTVAGQSVIVTQASVNCNYATSPTRYSAPAVGGPSSVSVMTTGSCSWTAAADVPWITIPGGANGTGNAAVSFSVASNSGAPRNGTIRIADQVFAVSQTGIAAPCSFILSGSGQTLPAIAAAGAAVNVTTSSGCAWTASSAVPWITITSGSITTGTGSVSFSVAANPAAQRSGTIAIAGYTYTVTQSGSAICSFSINPVSQSISAAGGAGPPIAVTTTAGCSWTATSNQAWLTLSSSASGTGNGTVTFTSSAHTGAARSGTLTIAGMTFTVNQAASCSYSINPNSQSFASTGGAGTTAVTAAAGCAWTAVSNTTWTTITAGAAGTGNGPVSFSVAANPTNRSRSGTITIASTTFTVSQAKP